MNERRYFSDAEGAIYLGVGKTMFRQIAKEANARIKLGRRILNDRERLDNYMNAHRQPAAVED